MAEFTGWLLDVFEHPRRGVVLWFLAEDGRRLRLRQDFPVTFYAAGPAVRLRSLWKWLSALPEPPVLARNERRDLFLPGPEPVLAVQAAQPVDQPGLFHRAQAAFPDLTYYDADVPLALRHAARFGTFPLARCRVETGEDNHLRELEVLDTRWELDPLPPSLNIMELEPDVDPHHAAPCCLRVRAGRCNYSLPLEPARPLLINLRALLRRFDPDLLLTDWGDTWLLPWLIDLAGRARLPLPLSREPGRGAARKAERSYFSYGQIVFRGAQVLLFGRWHIDRRNAVLWEDYGLPGTLEAARVTALPVQTAARTSPGTGISSMQIVTALQQDILVPWHKQQVERYKTALDLLHNDQGGMVYQPLVGLHRDVGGIDFVSMYPSIMVRANISPEVPPPQGLTPADRPPGLVPQTLDPLLKKRVALKQRLVEQPAWHPGRKDDKARSSAHKWLLVTCFGYLGYKNARFGRIEAHEAVTAGGREALLRAKEAAEDMDFSVLHLFVDGLWIHREGARSPEDFRPLLEEIASRTGLAIALDGIYRWVVFLPSRVDARLPVPNRYFGVFQDGSLKVRGIEARRRDSPPFVAELQMELLRWLAQAPSVDDIPAYLPGALGLLRRRLADLRAGRVPLEQLVMGQRLSRKLEAYTDLPQAARAALQLRKVGKEMRPGQRVRFLVLRGEPGVHAWDLPNLPDPAALDLARYRELALRAAETVFMPFGIAPAALRARAAGLPEAVPLGLHLDRGTPWGRRNASFRPMLAW